MMVVMRADGGPRIGWGHIMRCRSLALALRERNITVGFITGGDGSEASKLLSRDGFLVAEVGDLSNKGIGTLSPNDADKVVAIGREWRASIVLIDHYGITSSYLSAIAECFLVAVIDDCGGDYRKANWLLNQNLDADKLLYRTGEGATILRGPSFVLLRSEFLYMREERKRHFAADQNNVLVTFGGGQNAAITSNMLHHLTAFPKRLHVRALCGNDSEMIRDSLQLACTSRHEVEVFGKVDNMADHIAWADVSINAGGATCWELCCLGVPMVIVTLSDNQVGIAAALDRCGCAVNCGKVKKGNPPPKCIEALEELLENPGRRQVMAETGMTLVDGRGAWRVADSLMELISKVTIL